MAKRKPVQVEVFFGGKDPAPWADKLFVWFWVVLGVALLLGSLWFGYLQFVVGPSQEERDRQYQEEIKKRWEERDH